MGGIRGNFSAGFELHGMFGALFTIRQVPLLNFPSPHHCIPFGARPQASPGNVAYYLGSFNPVHNGHIQVALEAARQFKYDKVVFVPVFSAPHKDSVEMASFADRYEMLRRAVKDHPMLAVSDVESRLPAPSYSAQTVRELAKSDPRKRLPFIIGVDALKDLPRWHEPRTLVDKLRFIIAPRGDDRAPATVRIDGERHRLSRKKLDMTELGISSTQVRNRVAAGEDVSQLVPKAVDEFIRENELYRKAEGKTHA